MPKATLWRDTKGEESTALSLRGVRLISPIGPGEKAAPLSQLGKTSYGQLADGAVGGLVAGPPFMILFFHIMTDEIPLAIGNEI